MIRGERLWSLSSRKPTRPPNTLWYIHAPDCDFFWGAVTKLAMICQDGATYDEAKLLLVPLLTTPPRPRVCVCGGRYREYVHFALMHACVGKSCRRPNALSPPSPRRALAAISPPDVAAIALGYRRAPGCSLRGTLSGLADGQYARDRLSCLGLSRGSCSETLVRRFLTATPPRSQPVPHPARPRPSAARERHGVSSSRDCVFSKRRGL